MPGLRERKQLEAKQSIQQAAISLFAANGFASTTVEQIADRARVSPSTFFRYFGSKQDVVMYDSLDPAIIEAFRAQPKNIRPIPALRKAMKQVFNNLTPYQFELEMQRFTLVRTIPELQAKIIDEMARSIDLFAELIGERTGKDPNNLAVRNLAGAIIGAGMAALLRAYRDLNHNSVEAFDSALAQLEKGLEI